MEQELRTLQGMMGLELQCHWTDGQVCHHKVASKAEALSAVGASQWRPEGFPEKVMAFAPPHSVTLSKDSNRLWKGSNPSSQSHGEVGEAGTW